MRRNVRLEFTLFHRDSNAANPIRKRAVRTRNPLTRSAVPVNPHGRCTMHPIRRPCAAVTSIDRSSSSDALRKACRATRPRISSANYLIKRRRLRVGTSRRASARLPASPDPRPEVAGSRNTIKECIMPGSAHCIQIAGPSDS